MWFTGKDKKTPPKTKNKQQGNLTQRVRATPSSHCRQVVRRQKHFEESLKGLALNEGVQTSRIQAEGTEHIGERTQYFAGSRNLQKRLKCFTVFQVKGPLLACIFFVRTVVAYIEMLSSNVNLFIKYILWLNCCYNSQIYKSTHVQVWFLTFG